MLELSGGILRHAVERVRHPRQPLVELRDVRVHHVQLLLDHIVEFAPNPATHEAEYGFTNPDGDGEKISRKNRYRSGGKAGTFGYRSGS